MILLDRRAFLGLAALPLASCLATRPRASSSAPLPALFPDGERILRLAALAPSRHNSQPWRVTVRSERVWLVSIDESRRLPEVDPSGREMELALGAFVENLAQAARAYGWEAVIRAAEGPASVEVSLVPGRRGGSVDAIENRTTTLSDLDTGDLDAGDLAALSVDGRSVRYVSRDSAEGRVLSEATREGARLQIGRDAAQRELAAWIRWKTADAEQRQDGYTLESLGITGLAAFYVHRFLGPEAALGADFRDRARRRTDELLARCGGFLLFLTDGPGGGARMATGRVFERAFLSARSRGVGFHPMSQAVEEHLLSPDGSRSIELVVRVGHVTSAYPSPSTPRRPVAWFASTESHP